MLIFCVQDFFVNIFTNNQCSHIMIKNYTCMHIASLLTGIIVASIVTSRCHCNMLFLSVLATFLNLFTMTSISSPYDGLITTKTIDAIYIFWEPNCEQISIKLVHFEDIWPKMKWITNVPSHSMFNTKTLWLIVMVYTCGHINILWNVYMHKYVPNHCKGRVKKLQKCDFCQTGGGPRAVSQFQTLKYVFVLVLKI